MSSLNAVVIDSGSDSTRIGFAGMTEPSSEVVSAIGTRRNQRKDKSVVGEMTYLVGNHNEILDNSCTHDYTFMLRNGLIQDWDALEKLWHTCIYDKLHCDPEEHNFLLSESSFNPPESREQMAEIMFETFNVPGLYIGVQPILSMVASWGSVDRRIHKLTGTVVDSGSATTTVIPVANGHVLRNCIQQIPLGGRDITSFVQDLLRKNKRSIPPAQSFEVARQIKEKYGYTCSNLDKERQRSTKIAVSGTHSTSGEWGCYIDEEKYLAGEVLFRPRILRGSKSTLSPLPELTDRTIRMCPIDLRRELYGNIVLSSGSTRFRNFGRRLQRDLDVLTNNRLQECHSSARMEVKVIGDNSFDNSAWLGGSIVASDSRFGEWIITKQQYEEEGPKIARRSVSVYSTDPS